VPDVGTKVLVIADGDDDNAAALAERLGNEILSWGRAGAGPEHYAPEEAIAAALTLPGLPVVWPTAGTAPAAAWRATVR
jgi:microcystin degradation protein MlrC